MIIKISVTTLRYAPPQYYDSSFTITIDISQLLLFWKHNLIELYDKCCNVIYVNYNKRCKS